MGVLLTFGVDEVELSSANHRTLRISGSGTYGPRSDITCRQELCRRRHVALHYSSEQRYKERSRLTMFLQNPAHKLSSTCIKRLVLHQLQVCKQSTAMCFDIVNYAECSCGHRIETRRQRVCSWSVSYSWIHS